MNRIKLKHCRSCAAERQTVFVRQIGFTLVELLVVIAILGIRAAGGVFE